MSIYFLGYSSQNKRNWRLTDIDLIKADLINHFYTRIGERVMRPDFGCRLWDYLGEPFTDSLKSDVVFECERIIKAQKNRITLTNINVFFETWGMRIEMVVTYTPTNASTTINLEYFNEENK